jgi:hypothetical protein
MYSLNGCVLFVRESRFYTGGAMHLLSVCHYAMVVAATHARKVIWFNYQKIAEQFAKRKCLEVEPTKIKK